jgi:hypothetical protein
LPKFPNPPAPETLAEIEPAIKRLTAGTRVWRVYFRGGLQPGRWNQLRTFGPTTARFDHHLPDSAGEPREQTRAIQYLALDGITPLAEVFLHDILDHSLCGLGPSGHRNEAVALLQLAARTGADPTPDFAQMVDDDLLQGRVLGETFRELLPWELTKTLLAGIRNGKAIVERLQAQSGPEILRKRLIDRFFEPGRAGTSNAREHYASHGLEYGRRAPLGLALQRVLARADARVREGNLETAAGEIRIAPRHCGFEIREPQRWSSETAY